MVNCCEKPMKQTERGGATTMNNKVILPMRLDSYAGDTSELEVRLFKTPEDYPQDPNKSMWAAVHIVNGKIDHSLTDYGYHSLKELLTTYKNEKIIGLKENRKDAGLEEARGIAEDALEVLLTEDSVLLHIEGELNLPDGAIKKAYKTLQKARRDHAKVKEAENREA